MIVDTQKAEVQACPLCASQSFLRRNNPLLEGRSQFWVKCSNLSCGCTIAPAENQAEALERWNKRW